MTAKTSSKKTAKTVTKAVDLACVAPATPEEVPCMAQVKTKDLKQGETYFLPWDFWPLGGSAVSFVGHSPAKEVWKGAKGEVAKVRDKNGEVFIVGPGSYLFARRNPEQCEPKPEK